MNLHTVTITGADDNTEPSKLVELSKRYPFVEWGILVSKKQEGTKRFPSKKWINEFMVQFLDQRKEMRLSMHMCGAWVRQLFRGEIDWSELPSIAKYAQRVQINTHAEEHVVKDGFMKAVGPLLGRQVIFQDDGLNGLWASMLADAFGGIRVEVLLDRSGGAGILPDSWPQPSPDFPTGYAGGLGPDNVVEQLHKIAAVCKVSEIIDPPFWIDMERRVRSEDDSYLDMGKVEAVLKACEPFVMAKEGA